MKEVEILVKVHADLKTAKVALDRLPFQGTKKTLDQYFFDPKRPNLKPDERLALKECFRLRSKNDQHFLTYKMDRFGEDGKWTHSDEYETQVSDPDAAFKIIEHLGLKPLIDIDNTKYTYLTDTYEIVLEDVKNLGIFLEVERRRVHDDERVENVANEIRNFIQSLGIDFEELNIGKPELMLKITYHGINNLHLWS